MTTLTTRNRSTHARILEHYFVMVEALLQGDADGAQAAQSRFMHTLRHHAELEEQLVLPEARRLPIPPKGDPRLIEHDHGLLEEALHAIDELCAAWHAQSPPDRPAWLARRLNVLARFENLFEHHTVRECEFLYAALDQHAPHQSTAGWDVVFAQPEPGA